MRGAAYATSTPSTTSVFPRRPAGYDQARDCPERNCMVEALSWFSAVVADKNAPIMTRRLAASLCRPPGGRHASAAACRPAADRGGIDISVSYRGAATNLHFFWDANWSTWKLAMRRKSPSGLQRTLTAADRLKWQAGDPKQWTDESLMLVRSHAYNTGASGESNR